MAAAEKEKKASGLSFSAKGRTRSAKLASKRTMNLYYKATDGNSMIVVIPAAIILFIAVACLAKFGVLDRYSRLDTLRSEVASQRNQLAAYNSALTDYDEVQEQYRRYTNYYMSDEELALVNRLEMLQILQDCSAGNAVLESIGISENMVVLSAVMPDLDTLAVFKKSLENDEHVVSVTVNSANREEYEGEWQWASDPSDTVVRSSMVVVMQLPQNEDTGEEVES